MKKRFQKVTPRGKNNIFNFKNIWANFRLKIQMIIFVNNVSNRLQTESWQLCNCRKALLKFLLKMSEFFLKLQTKTGGW